MSVFDLHSQVLADYRDFVRSFFTVADDRAREYVERALIEEARLWPDFLLQVSPPYVGTNTVDELVRRARYSKKRRRYFARLTASLFTSTSIKLTLWNSLSGRQS